MRMRSLDKRSNLSVSPYAFREDEDEYYDEEADKDEEEEEDET
jgi:hypothetical protein